MDQVTKSGLYCCIVSRRHAGAVNTLPFFITRTLAKTKRDSIAMLDALIKTESEYRTLHFERCSKVTIREVLK